MSKQLNRRNSKRFVIGDEATLLDCENINITVTPTAEEALEDGVVGGLHQLVEEDNGRPREEDNGGRLSWMIQQGRLLTPGVSLT